MNGLPFLLVENAVMAGPGIGELANTPVCWVCLYPGPNKAW